jgi:sugar (pentulose or hexulose) kinase
VAGFEEYIFVGGGVKNALWLAIVADILGIDARIAQGVDAAAGAAMLVGIGTGVFPNLSDAVQNRRKEEKTIRHDAANHEQYTHLFERYLTMKQAFDRIYS